jgi:hypothetical protein
LVSEPWARARFCYGTGGGTEWLGTQEKLCPKELRFRPRLAWQGHGEESHGGGTSSAAQGALKDETPHKKGERLGWSLAPGC